MLEYLLPVLLLPILLALTITLIPLFERNAKLRKLMKKRELNKTEEGEVMGRLLLFVIMISEPLIYAMMIIVLISRGLDYAATHDLENVLIGIGLAAGLAGAGCIIGSGFIIKKIPLSAVLGDSVDPLEEKGYQESREGQESKDGLEAKGSGDQKKDKAQGKNISMDISSVFNYIVFLGLLHLSAVLGLITGILIISTTGILDSTLPYETMTDEVRNACLYAGVLVGVGGFLGATLSGFVMSKELDKEDPATGKTKPLDNEEFARVLMKGAMVMTIAIFSFMGAFLIMSNAGVFGG